MELFPEQQSTICLDWLQLYCIGTVSDTTEFKFNLLEYSTRQFSELYSIFYKNVEIGTASAKPSSKIINPRAVIIKFTNRLLYSRSAKYFIEKFLRATKLFFKSITRADIARDFHKFSNNYNPQTFIQEFFSGKYLKNGRGKFTTIGEQKKMNVYEYLSFGSRKTGKRIYLYNKTKELEQIGDKPHIKLFWERNGLIVDKTVWRLEFSFKGSQNKLVDTVSGLIDKINWKDLFDLKKLITILSAAINDLFSFKINDNTKNKTRMPDLKLFDNLISGVKLVKLPDVEDKIKPIKILLKNLVKEYNGHDPHKYGDLYALHHTITAIALNHNLISYLKNVIKYDIPNLPNPFCTTLSNDQLNLI